MATIEIDQSGKWESSTHTVIGFSVGSKLHSVIISPKTKGTIYRVLGNFDQNKNRSKKKLIIRMFTYSVFLAIRDIVREGDELVIDLEYPGNEESIRDLMIHLIRTFAKIDLSRKSIQFCQIGKGSLAHLAAYETFTYRRSPNKQLTFEDYHELLDRTVQIREKAFMKRKNREK